MIVSDATVASRGTNSVLNRRFVTRLGCWLTAATPSLFEGSSARPSSCLLLRADLWEGSCSGVKPSSEALFKKAGGAAPDSHHLRNIAGPDPSCCGGMGSGHWEPWLPARRGPCLACALVLVSSPGPRVEYLLSNILGMTAPLTNVVPEGSFGVHFAIIMNMPLVYHLDCLL